MGSTHAFGFLYWRCCTSTYLGSHMVQVNILYYDVVINRYSFLYDEFLAKWWREDLFMFSYDWYLTHTIFPFFLRFFLFFSFLFLFGCLWWMDNCQGLDALGLATLDSINSMTATRIPFGSSVSVSMMTKEDVNNLRTLGRLILLLSGSQENPSNQVGNSLLLLLTWLEK